MAKKKTRCDVLDRGLLRQGLVDKMNPGRLRVSPKFAAILACLLDESWTRPALTALCLTCDRVLIGQMTGDVGFNHVLAAETDLRRNINGACEVAGVTPEEKAYLLDRVEACRV